MDILFTPRMIMAMIFMLELKEVENDLFIYIIYNELQWVIQYAIIKNPVITGPW